MGRRSITGGVIPANGRRIQFDFTIDRARYRPTLPWEPTEANLRSAREHLRRIKARIAAGTFNFADEFPDFRGLHKLPLSLRAQTCSNVFDAFLRHEETRVIKGDLAPATLASHRIAKVSIMSGAPPSARSHFSAYGIRPWSRWPIRTLGKKRRTTTPSVRYGAHSSSDIGIAPRSAIPPRPLRALASAKKTGR